MAALRPLYQIDAEPSASDSAILSALMMAGHQDGSSSWDDPRAATVPPASAVPDPEQAKAYVELHRAEVDRFLGDLPQMDRITA